jgi:hypothetical protein
VHVVASNIGTNTPLPAGEPIELAFDRLLLPISVTRQSFLLVDEADTSTAITFSIAYDPVARVVTLNPILPPLAESHTYQLSISSPSDPTNSSGIHAIDGATMDPNVTAFPRTITFPVAAAAATAPALCNGVLGACLDFCTDIAPIFTNPNTNTNVTPPIPTNNCSGSSTCHNGQSFVSNPTGLSIAAGLALTGPLSSLPAVPPTAQDPNGFPAIPSMAQFIQATAIGRLSIESAMGALSDPGPPASHFGQDMPIIDVSALPEGPQGSGDPANSFLIYKVLMAGTGGLLPPKQSALPNVYSVNWAPMSDAERTTLASLIPGREMPLPGVVTDTPNAYGLPIDSLERLSLWISQGAPVAECPQ